MIIGVAMNNSNTVTSNGISVPVSYFDVNGKNGEVRIHTGMSKDSVILLVGKPDKFESSTVRGHNLEELEYFIHSDNEFMPDLEITLIDGIITEVDQD